MTNDPKLRDPSDLAEEVWDCLVGCHLDPLVKHEAIPGEVRAAAIDYLGDVLRGDRELILRRLLNGGG